MATETTLPPARTTVAPSDLSDLVLDYADLAGLPPTDWLTRLKLERPRRDVRSLGEGTRLAKRLTDIVISSIMLVCLLPLMVLVAIAVKLTSPGPMIFSQLRVGLNYRKPRPDRRKRNDDLPEEISDNRRQASRRSDTGYGRPFVLYKFRTMRTDAEKNGAQFAQKNDPRVTSIGRFMRKTRLDELPQLWNVLKGDMSLVGPRPERPEFIEKLSAEVPGYLHRLGLKPGLTGIAQVVNGYDNNIESFKRKVALDLLYLQNCCFWNDLKILFRTIRVVLTGSGAL
ncbi:MAG: Undecaprenyl-phosphate galactose phosphotransferase [Planctomycetaceae bacterium]|nr:Undecaprenyl-phosphate galactose phosphotransferase [Planctomycetaceae bacterium]